MLERGVQIQAVEVERLEVEHHLPGLLDRALEDALGLLQRARAARGVERQKFLAEVELVAQAREGLDQAVVDVQRDARALLADGVPHLPHIQAVEGLVLAEMPLDLLLAADPLIDQLPHELGARAAHHGQPRGHRGIEREERLGDLLVARHVDDRVGLRQAEQPAVVGGDRDLQLAGEEHAGGVRVEVGDPDDGDQRIVVQDVDQRRAAAPGADDGHADHVVFWRQARPRRSDGPRARQGRWPGAGRPGDRGARGACARDGAGQGPDLASRRRLSLSRPVSSSMNWVTSLNSR